MKKNGIYICLAAFGAALLSFWLISRSGDTYLNSIPSDSRALFEINFRQITEQTDVDLASVFSEILSEENVEVGLNMSKPILGFYMQNGYLGLVAQISDASALEGTLQQRGYEIDIQRGLYWCVLENWLLCFDNDKLLLLGPGALSDQDALRIEMHKLMEQDECESPLLTMLQERQGMVKSVADLSLLSDADSQAKFKDLSAKIPQNELFLFASLNAEDKEISLSSEVITDNDSILAIFNEMNATFHEFEGTHQSAIVLNSLFWTGMNITGDKLLEQLREIPDMRTTLLALNMCVDADMMFKSIDGDVTLSVPQVSLLSPPSFLLRAKLGNTDFLQNVDDWKTGVSVDAGVDFQEYSPTDFSLKYKQDRYYFGVYEEHLYLTNDKDIVTKLKNESSLPDVLPDTNDCRIYATLDASRMLKLVSSYLLWLGAPPAFYELLDAVKCVNLKLHDAQHYEIELLFDDNISDLVSRTLESNPE